MDYSDMPLEDEIRRCLASHRHAIHPTNIRRWIIGDRFERSIADCIEPDGIQSLKRITNVMSEMDDIEVVRIKNRYYRRFKTNSKLTRAKQWAALKYCQIIFLIKDMSLKLKL